MCFFAGKRNPLIVSESTIGGSWITHPPILNGENRRAAYVSIFPKQETRFREKVRSCSSYLFR